MPIDAKPEDMGIPAEEGYTPPVTMGRAASDWATSFIRGLAKGTVGMPGAVDRLIDTGIEKGAELTGHPFSEETIKMAHSRPNILPTPEQVGHGLSKVGIPEKAETRGGEYAETIGEFAGPSMAGKGKLAAKALQAVTGGAGSEAAGKAAEGSKAEPYARVLGAMGGMGLPGMIKRAVTPFPIGPERKALVDILRKEGVEPSAGDVSGSKTVRYAEHALGDAPGAGGANTAAREKIKDDFTKAVLKRVGEDSTRATPEIIDRAFTRIGSEFDRLSAAHKAQIDPAYVNDLMKAQKDYEHLFVDPLAKPMVQNVVDHAFNQLAKSRVMDGEQYQALRSRIEKMRSRAARGGDPDVSDFLGDVRKAMDDLMERNIAKTSPKDLGAWKDARKQYRNMMVVERAATGAADEAAPGAISPARLRQALVQQSRRGYARGQGDFSDLARAGDTLLKPPPSSGTSERAWLHAIPAAIGGGLGKAFGGAPEALAAATAGAAAPGVAGRALMTPAIQSYLKNQAITKDLSPGALEAMIRSAIAEQAH